jgi:hypothetical protein
MINLGRLYENGKGVKLDHAKAREWYQRGADAGNTIAMNLLGRLYEKGLGVAREYAKAREWYQKAADMPGTPMPSKRYRACPKTDTPVIKADCQRVPVFQSIRARVQRHRLSYQSYRLTLPERVPERRIILRAVYPRRNFPHSHLVGRVGEQQLFQVPVVSFT